MNEVLYDPLLDPYNLINFCDEVQAPEEIKSKKKFKKKKFKEKKK